MRKRDLLVMRRLLIVGQAPSRTSDPRRPLEGDRIKRALTGLLGIDEATYLREVERVNLLATWAPKESGGEGDAFDRALGRAAAACLANGHLRFPSQRHVLLLGRNVARAFDGVWTPPSRLADGVPIRWHVRNQTVWVAVLPHPSGVNRWWNDPKNRRAARRFMRRLGRAVSGGETWPA